MKADIPYPSKQPFCFNVIILKCNLQKSYAIHDQSRQLYRRKKIKLKMHKISGYTRQHYISQHVAKCYVQSNNSRLPRGPLLILLGLNLHLSRNDGGVWCSCRMGSCNTEPEGGGIPKGTFGVRMRKGIPKLIHYPNNMSAQLKDLAAKCRRIGGLNSLDTEKKKVGEGEDGGAGAGAGKTVPKRSGRTTIVINEPRAEAVKEKEKEKDKAPRKSKASPVEIGEEDDEGSGSRVSKKAATELVLDTPETLKALLASFTPETRRKELLKTMPLMPRGGSTGGSLSETSWLLCRRKSRL
ncbi:uncharacterized protein LOC141678436 [Apium graveolens]|uniref:uncharacterized protein LOC141678436 n=1 Tax=Apium graveolens TaxID=4045 RepID=UPI003D78CECF